MKHSMKQLLLIASICLFVCEPMKAVCSVETLFFASESGVADTIGYQTLELALRAELQKPCVSSHANDYMKSLPYQHYKSYIYTHPEAIKQMFQCFLFKESPNGLYGYLIDDIIRNKYPEAPSIRDLVAHTASRDDELVAINDYQQIVCRFINRESEEGAVRMEVNDESNRLREQENRKAWREANAYRRTITDSVFLKTETTMSDQAVDYVTPTGWNMDYAYNQVVYLEALRRIKKHLFVEENQLVLRLQSGAEINMSEDLFEYIAGYVIDQWNEWLRKGRVVIEKNREGFYDIVPPKDRRKDRQ